MNGADVIISIGCDLSRLPAPRGVVQHWNVPDFSPHFDGAELAIREQVTKLVDDLMSGKPLKH